MNTTIAVDYPEFLADSLRLNKEDFSREMKISALMKLFENGRVTSGIAAKVLGVSRLDFLEILSENRVEFLDSGNIREDLENA